MAMLENGFHDLPPGKVATIVTHLEMTAPAAPRPVPTPDGVALRQVTRPETEWYRSLFRRVGSEDWLWTSRLRLSDSDLAAILHHPEVAVHAVERDGEALGLLELDFREAGACELVFFGLAAPLIGGGVGRWMMNNAIRLAWKTPISRFHLHTCTLDHPDALSFYRRSGFVAVRQQVEIADDPRVTGALAEAAAPQIPIIR